MALHSHCVKLCTGSDRCLVWRSFVCCLPLFVTSKVSFTSSSLVTAEGWWVGLILQPVCLSIPTCLSLPKLSGAARTNLSGRWGAGFLHVTWETPKQHNLRPTMQCVWTLWNPTGESMQRHTWPRFSEESLCIMPVCVYLLLGSFRRTLHLLFIPWNKAGPWREHRLHAQTRCLTHTHIHTQTCTQMGLLLLPKSRQLWRERGGTVGICICRWEKKLHLPQGPAVEMNQLSMVCRSDPILLITKSQNNKDQKVVGHAVCSSFVVP